MNKIDMMYDIKNDKSISENLKDVISLIIGNEVNLNSMNEVRELLYSKLKYPVIVRDRAGNPSLAKAVIGELKSVRLENSTDNFKDDLIINDQIIATEDDLNHAKYLIALLYYKYKVAKATELRNIATAKSVCDKDRKSLIEMLCEKFNKEIPNLEFAKVRGRVIESYVINEEVYELDTEVDAIKVTNSDEVSTIVYANHGMFSKIPDAFSMDDFVKIYETLTKISGKAVKLHRGKHDDGIVVEPRIEI